MSIEDIKTPDYRKKHKYDNLNSVDRVIKESQDLLNESIRHRDYLDGLTQDIVRFTFNCPGFKGSGYSEKTFYTRFNELINANDIRENKQTLSVYLNKK